MVWSRRVVVSVVLAVAALGLVIYAVVRSTGGGSDEGAGPRIVQPGAPGQSGRTLSPEEVSSLKPSAHTAADTLFMQQMIAHHEQALQMTALVPGRSRSSDLALLAERIEVSQRDEIAQMQRWLSDRGEQIPQPHASHTGHPELMPGMLTAEQLRQLEQARGAQFDRLFLQFMIQHHEGALVMARDLYTKGGGLEAASDRFAREVNADQSIEISRMRDLLTQLA
jgi:uncharacterized protein (DUF305 family)